MLDLWAIGSALPESAGYRASGKSVAFEEVREGESAGSPGVRWVLTVALNEATLSPATRAVARSEITSTK